MTLLWPLLFFTFLALAVVAWLWGPPLLSALRRARIRRQPFPLAWREILRRRMPAYSRLPVDLQLRLKKQVQVLAAEKQIAVIQKSAEPRVHAQPHPKYSPVKG